MSNDDIAKYRVVDKDGNPLIRRVSVERAACDVATLSEEWPDRAPFTVQRCEWVDVPLPEPLPADLPTEVWTCERWRLSNTWAVDTLSPLPGRGRRFRSRVDWEEVPE